MICGDRQLSLRLLWQVSNFFDLATFHWFAVIFHVISLRELMFLCVNVMG